MLTSFGLIALLKINIWVFVVGDTANLSYDEYLGFMRYKYAEIGLEPVVKQIIFVPDFFPRIDSPRKRLKNWQWLLSAAGVTRPGRMVHVLIPKKKGEIRNGIAIRCGIKKRNSISISEVSDHDDAGGPQGLHSAYDLVRQTARTLGARMRNTDSVMSRELLQLVSTFSYGLKWDEESIAQIHDCIKRPVR